MLRKLNASDGNWWVVIVALTCLMGAGPAKAEFSLGGYSPQVVRSEKGLDHAAMFIQTVRLWDVSGAEKSVDTSFTLPANQAIPFARLYLDVYGANKTYTAQVTVTLNGTLLPIIALNAEADTNPVFDGDQTCVYGSSIGQWQLAMSGIADLLYKDGTPNTLNVVVNKTNGTSFDGRIVDATLVAVYRNPSIIWSLDYFLAEGDGYLRKPPANPTYGNAPAQRSVLFTGLNTANVISASYTTLYTHGDANQADRLFFNGIQLGGNDVAYGQYGTYGPDLPVFDVASYLAADSTLLYDVNTVGAKAGETSILAKLGVLTVTHPIPGDADINGKVDVSDLGILAANYGTTNGGKWAAGDFNNDGKVDVSDLGILAANYGSGVGGAPDFAADAKALGLPVDGTRLSAKTETPVSSTLGCGSVGLPLIAGLCFLCVLMVKLEEHEP